MNRKFSISETWISFCFTFIGEYLNYCFLSMYLTDIEDNILHFVCLTYIFFMISSRTLKQDLILLVVYLFAIFLFFDLYIMDKFISERSRLMQNSIPKIQTDLSICFICVYIAFYSIFLFLFWIFLCQTTSIFLDRSTYYMFLKKMLIH